MYKIIKNLTLIFALLILCQAKTFAGNKASVQIGTISFKADSISDQTTNGQTSINITKVLSISGLYDSHLIITLPDNFFAAVDTKKVFELVEVGNSTANSGNISFSALTKYKAATSHVGGRNRLASNSDTLIQGTLKVISYNPATKVLHFTVKAKAKPYSKSSIELVQGDAPFEDDPVTINKSILITANLTTTLTSL